MTRMVEGRFELPNPKDLQSAALPLRYPPTYMVEDDGIEPPTPACKAGALPAELILHFAWQRPTLTGTRSQLPSALESLTSVFGMGTGVTSLPSLPDCIHLRQESFNSFDLKVNKFLYSFKTR